MSVRKIYYVDKNLILGAINSKQKTVSQFCKELGCSRVNLYVALNKGYTKPRSLFMTKVIEALGLIDSLVWYEEEFIC